MFEISTDFTDRTICGENETCFYRNQSKNLDQLDEQMDQSAIMQIDEHTQEPPEQKHTLEDEKLILEPLTEMKNGRTGWSQAMDGIAVLTNSLGMIVYSLDLEPHYLKKMMKLKNRYEEAKASLRGSDELTDVIHAAYECRVDTIFVEAGKTISGKYDANTGSFELGSLDDTECGDIVEAIVIAVMKDKQDIIVLPSSRMPTDTGLAAFFRY